MVRYKNWKEFEDEDKDSNGSSVAAEEKGKQLKWP
jgi:hypothetical protein